jgi:hypothetical protein
VSWCHEHGIGLLYTPCAGRLSQHGRISAAYSHSPGALWAPCL